MNSADKTSTFNKNITLSPEEAAKRVDMLSEDEILGLTLEEIAGRDITENLNLLALSERGIRHQRANRQPGSVVIVPNEEIIQMGQVLCANGLSFFKSRTPIVVWTKEVDLPEGTYLEENPVDGDHRIRTKYRLHSKVLVGRVNIVDPIFPAKDGKIPGSYITAALNIMNPAIAWWALPKDGDGSLKDLLSRAMENARRLAASIQLMNTRFANFQTSKDQKLLQDWSAINILHEETHQLINALPAGDIPPGQEEKQGKITFEKWIDVLLPDLPKDWLPAKGGDFFLETRMGQKNLYKALRSVRTLDPGPRARDTIIRVWALEMFCDRFAMFLYENYNKNLIYQAALNIKGRYLLVSELNEAGRAREEGPDQFTRYLAAHGASFAGDSASVQELSALLHQTESDNVFVKGFQDPGLTSQERAFFRLIIEHLAHLDSEHTINQYSIKHSETSTPIRLGASGAITHSGASVSERTVKMQ